MGNETESELMVAWRAPNAFLSFHFVQSAWNPSSAVPFPPRGQTLSVNFKSIGHSRALCLLITQPKICNPKVMKRFLTVAKYDI